MEILIWVTVPIVVIIVLLLIVLGIILLFGGDPTGKRHVDEKRTKTEHVEKHETKKIRGWRFNPISTFLSVVVVCVVIFAFVLVTMPDVRRGLIRWASIPTTTSVCDGQITSISLSSGIERVVNPGGQCAFTFEVAEGAVRFANTTGSIADWEAGQAAGGKMSGVVRTAEALTPTATLNFMLCPIGRPIDGWKCL